MQHWFCWIAIKWISKNSWIKKRTCKTSCKGSNFLSHRYEKIWGMVSKRWYASFCSTSRRKNNRFYYRKKQMAYIFTFCRELVVWEKLKNHVGGIFYAKIASTVVATIASINTITTSSNNEDKLKKDINKVIQKFTLSCACWICQQVKLQLL